ncbi:MULTISPECIES: ferritin-like fold-containing protein [unclassified Diaminobutyricimonas]|uniref:ferritin-like fold-containing protein n=1 Tax=unclassified Diaminobutyricimonas TaxID=2643261 RepID=UPI0012F4D64C|nr:MULTISPECIES: ferritin-like fold-containing protein [unclassified Diaminobutyricimonas]
MVNWFSRARARIEAPTVKPRSTVSSAARVELSELAPNILDYLGQVAYLQLSSFEALSLTVIAAPTTEAKRALAEAARLALNKHHELVRAIERRGKSAVELMDRSAARIDEFRRLVRGDDWHEMLMTAYVTSGFLDDFFVGLAGGLTGHDAEKAIEVLSGDSAEEALFEQLRIAIEADEALASRLAMWGRRLMGDTILLARESLVYSEDHDSDEARIEPVLTELIATHTRRMDALGLTA